MVGFIVLVLVLLARAYPGSGADLVDWRPTRSYEDEARLGDRGHPADDRGAERDAPAPRRARADAGGCLANGAGGRGDPGAPAALARRAARRSSRTSSASRCSADRSSGGRSLARALIVGCGCRGQELGRRLVGAGWQARGTTRDPGNAEDILAARLEAVVADPDRVGSILDHVGDVALVFWLLGSALGEPEAIAAIHGPRLERLMEELVDTPVRGFVYEAGGAGAAPPPRAWRRDRPRGGGALANPGRGGRRGPRRLGGLDRGDAGRRRAADRRAES